MKLRGLDSRNWQGVKVLMRVDFNVPFRDGKVTDCARITAHRETVQRLVDAGALVSLVSHFGRPKGKVDPAFSLSQIRTDVERELGYPVTFVDDCVGDLVASAVATQKNGQVLLLENTRFHEEEQKNDDSFSALMAAPYDVWVMDAFSAAHRADCSTEGLSHHLPAVSGLLMQKEVDALSAVRDNPVKPFCLVLGGAKVADKIPVIEFMMDKADSILIGGGMAFTFLAVQGHSIGRSLYDGDHADFARSMLEWAASQGVKILLPVDVVAAATIDAPDSACVVKADAIPDELMGVDVGPETARIFGESASQARTVLWNGPLGVFEVPAFAQGSKSFAETLAQATEKGTFSVVGGGDTASAVKKFGVKDRMSHVSTGGGASLEFCEGKLLPGIAPLIEE